LPISNSSTQLLSTTSGIFHDKDFEGFSPEKQDEVINPKHYKVLPDYEYMQIMEHVLGDEVIGHLRGQIFKYLFRFGGKDVPLQEAKKIAWYANYLEDYLERRARGETPYNPRKN
jgi:hypothetical protein